MLKNLDPLPNVDLLHILRAMGHGDDLVIVDGNFPAAATGKRVVRLDGVDAPRAATGSSTASSAPPSASTPAPPSPRPSPASAASTATSC
jgi:L-fucose mutarotase